MKLAGSKVKVPLAASTRVPKGLELPLVLEGDGGKTKTVMVDPSKPFEVDAGFPVKRTKWDPERTVLAFVR